MRLICEVVPALAEQGGPPAFRHGGNDSITYVFAPLWRPPSRPRWRIVSSLVTR
ncbi:hypothetical protein ABZ897_43175 [Nonomuraea sp. NPDC046802]|uniref:hypothetical protein n=1 Tax=Nonomuraea sp. NPDC046802 TaxID=3154919 RepID=UPI0033CD5CB7